MQEHVLSLNDFGMPIVYSKSDAEYMLIIRLLLLEPGIFQSHPNMGIGLRSKYRYNNAQSLLQDLQNDIKTQISLFLPELSAAEISLTLGKSNTLGIVIDTGNGAYVLAYNSESNKIDVADNATYILNDL